PDCYGHKSFSAPREDACQTTVTFVQDDPARRTYDHGIGTDARANARVTDSEGSHGIHINDGTEREHEDETSRRNDTAHPLPLLPRRLRRDRLALERLWLREDSRRLHASRRRPRRDALRRRRHHDGLGQRRLADEEPARPFRRHA